MLSSWRKSLEQSLFGGGFPFGPAPERVGGVRTPGSPNTRSETPQTDRQTPLDGRFGQEGSKTPSDDGRLSPARSEDSRSPVKAEGVSPTPSPSPLPASFPGLVPRSFANSVAVASSNTNTNSSSSQLSIPPLFTSRIPKGDPLEERLHDMLR